jgi:phospholipase/carboxylesterase
MPTVEGFELDTADVEGFPVAIGHGTYDPVIGIEWGHDARDRLSAAGAGVRFREYPLPHSVDPGFLDEVRREWLPEVLGL